ncbi:MAG: hypothetical protein QM718_12940 [Steroidobacteraceae bacterium]
MPEAPAPLDWARLVDQATRSSIGAGAGASNESPAPGFDADARRAVAADIAQGAPRPDMGSIPESPLAASSASIAQYPWSRQPLSRHFDFHAGVLTLRTRRCVIGLIIVLPAFGCLLGHIDPEPGRSDLFDGKYQAPPLQLPRSALGDGKFP